MGICSKMEPKPDVKVMSNIGFQHDIGQHDIGQHDTGQHDIHKFTKSMFAARPIELVRQVKMKQDCIVHWTLVWTVHPEDLGTQGPRAIKLQIAIVHWTLVGTVVRRPWDPRTESCLNFISNCHFIFLRIRIFVRGAVIACRPYSRFWVKDSHSKLADSFDESLDLSDWLKSGDSFSSSV